MESGEEDDLLDITFVKRNHHHHSQQLRSTSTSPSSSSSSSTSPLPLSSSSSTDRQAKLLSELKMFLTNNCQDIAAFGTDLAINGEYDRAIEYLSLAISLNSSDYRLYFNRAFCYLETNEPNKALKDIIVSIKSNPLWAKGYFKLGQILARIKQFKQAELAYKKALTLEPNCSETRAEISGNIYDALIAAGFDEIKAGYASSKYFSIDEAHEGLIAGVFETNLMLARSIKKRQLKRQIHKKGVLYPINFF